MSAGGKKAAVASVTEAPRLEIFECEQGSEEWFKLRVGLPTASRFADVMAGGEGKTRAKLLYELAAEIVTGEPGESFQSQAMARGKEMEEKARVEYAFRKNVELRRIGFARNGRKGASPDSLVGADGGVEFKTRRGDLMVETLLKGDSGSAFAAQIQGNMWVLERAWWDLAIFWPGLPQHVTRFKRDDRYIARMSDSVDQFLVELDEIVAKIKRMGEAR